MRVAEIAVKTWVGEWLYCRATWVAGKLLISDGGGDVPLNLIKCVAPIGKCGQVWNEICQEIREEMPWGRVGLLGGRRWKACGVMHGHTFGLLVYERGKGHLYRFWSAAEVYRAMKLYSKGKLDLSGLTGRQVNLFLCKPLRGYEQDFSYIKKLFKSWHK